MKITRRRLRRIIKEALDPEYMREEIMSFAEETDADGLYALLDIIGGEITNFAGDDESSLDAAFDVIDKHVTGSYPEDLAYIHQELTNAGYFG